MNHWRQFWDNHATANRDADPHVQVLRTWQKAPVSAQLFGEMIDSIKSHLAFQPAHRLLDLCCGNGVVTQQLADQCAEIVAVDFVADLVNRIDTTQHPNIHPLQLDVRRCRFHPACFDRVLIYAGLQYFTPMETIALVESMHSWLRPGGRMFLGDIPDADRMWNFFDTPERQAEYFRRVQIGEPIIGTWYHANWLLCLCERVGFESVRIVYQPKHFPFQHFRFDLIAEMPA